MAASRSFSTNQPDKKGALSLRRLPGIFRQVAAKLRICLAERDDRHRSAGEAGAGRQKLFPDRHGWNWQEHSAEGARRCVGAASARTLTRKGVGIEGWLMRKWNTDRKSTRLNSSHLVISYAVFCLQRH